MALQTKETQFAFQTKESGAARLVRTSVKAVHPHGSDEAGIASDFISFLKGKGKKRSMVTFRGNRFNILFYDAGALYEHWDDLSELLKGWPDPNRLLSAVMEDMNNLVHKAGVRALGIIDKLITGPFWRLIEKKGSILDLNPFLLQMKNKLEVWGTDASPLLEGVPLFDENDVELHKDNIWDALFSPCDDVEFNMLTQQALEMCMHSILLVLERLAADQLPGGKYFIPSDSLKQMAQHVPKTNKISEADFAILDLLVRKKPNASINTFDALIMWSKNKTMEWLDNLPIGEKQGLFKDARKGAASMAEKFKLRKAILEEEKADILKKKLEQKVAKEAKENQKKTEATNSLAEIGKLWVNEDEIDTSLEEFEGDLEKRKALLCQINFHKIVLKSKGPKLLFNKTKLLSEKRVDLNVAELTSNLKEIVNLNPVSTPDGTEETTIEKVKPRQERDLYFQAEKGKLYLKLQEARKKRIISQQKDKLPIYLKDPGLLVQKRVKHRVVEEKGEESFWCDGIVQKITKQNAGDSLHTEYQVHYDIEEESKTWKFPLLIDLKKGDLIIL